MSDRAPNLNYRWTNAIVEELVRNGVERFCLSPGSRCTPLTLAVAAHAGARSTVHFDERGTAFHALGLAKATGRPVAFICTSGTAAANALPAVVEASMARVPLILLTADRPPELQDTGANQTIEQPGIYANYVRWTHSLPCPDERVPLASVLTAIDQGVARAMGPPAGPVHVNCMFREPLEPAPEPYSEIYVESTVARWSNSGEPFTTYVQAEPHPAERALAQVREIIDSTARGVLLVGQLDSDRDVAAAEALARTLGWPVLADITSGMRRVIDGVRGVHYYDQILVTKDAAIFESAQTVLHVGGAVTSKRLNAFLAGAKASAYIRVADHPFRRDPAHRVSHRVTSSLEAFAREIATPNERDTDWIDRLEEASMRVGERIAAFLESDNTLNEISLARCVSRHVPEGAVLFLGNSMPIRDADMYGAPATKRIIVAANRGASGIDGNIATAAGYAAGRDAIVTAVLGDLAVLHDLNSLALLRSAARPVVLVALNNDGGGIFSLLPVSEFEEPFEEFFGTPHGLSLESVAAAFELPYARPGSIAEFEAVYGASLERGASCIIEVRTDRRANAELHRRLEASLASV